MAKTIHETIGELQRSFIDYIEATYHVGNPALIAQRNGILNRPGTVFQPPYIESTPRYQPGLRFRDIQGLTPAALELFEALSKPRGGRQLVYDPPYSHQSEALQRSLVADENLLIMTGTGSGKTESFLLPILGKLATEASKSKSFASQDAMRALILYPMNALVNDQLGRLRAFFGDTALQALFKTWSGRPARFARYTSRTPYAGVRTTKKDQVRLKPFRDFFVELLRKTRNSTSPMEQKQAAKLLEQLNARGKWPAKPDIEAWYGDEGTRWQDRNGNYIRAVTLPNDSELVTRDEAQHFAPDLLVTNYSMLEYMLMRPIERTIFDRTAEWLAHNPDEKFLIVLDEAHLYRGAAGAEVGLLLRRLRDRLNIGPNRFQVICATASFSDAEIGPDFGAKLAGVPRETFHVIEGKLQYRLPASTGLICDAEALAQLDLDGFYSEDQETRARSIASFLEYRKLAPGTGCIDLDLYHALSSFPPLGLLTNWTMDGAKPIAELGKKIFPEVPLDLADVAVTNLLTLSSTARSNPQEASLLPCRIHNFFRGLPGLWVCMDPDCTELAPGERSGICGKMYSQPHGHCGCGAPVLEFYTCRYCGTSYARAYTDNVDDPTSLWAEPGKRVWDGVNDVLPLSPIDLLLEEPRQHESAEPADYDLESGQLNPRHLSSRGRRVYMRASRIEEVVDDEDEGGHLGRRGEFQPCAVCGQSGRGSRSTVQDHETKGDQPFQSLVARQIQIQPPGPVSATAFAPLRCRKVLTFSDSRQVAARLAPNLQMYSARDSLRPTIARGYRRLLSVASLRDKLSLEDLYCAVLLAANELGVRLRPELAAGESFSAYSLVGEAVKNGTLASDHGLYELCRDIRDGDDAPASLLGEIVRTVQDRLLGLEALAIASIAERGDKSATVNQLPDIAGIAETPEAKAAIARAWLRCWHRTGFWLRSMPADWRQGTGENGLQIQLSKGTFQRTMNRIFTTPGARRAFKSWLPELLRIFTEETAGKHLLLGRHLTLTFDGDWVRCQCCKSVHRPIPGVTICLDCGQAALDKLDPTNDAAFLARKGFYRQAVMAALQASPSEPPMALIAAEHTAQLNSPQSEDVFSKAEVNELLFQDIDISLLSREHGSSAVDVLSSTTTMEVGIDIGALSGVALRNMPPSRANYQQRAGRAGRRGNSIATVVAYGGMDTHDEHHFSHPDAMIRGPVIDPILTLDNPDIARRHVRAFLLQKYHQDRIPGFDSAQPPDLFSVLGTVDSFRSTYSVLNREDFVRWLQANETDLVERVASWIPDQLCEEDRHDLLTTMVPDCLEAIDKALLDAAIAADKPSPPAVTWAEAQENPEVQAEAGDNNGIIGDDSPRLLDWLLYKGVLPRYAFPTDVATFHVFDTNRSTRFRPVMKFAPSQGLPVALSQYAPGKQVWISGKCYTSGAIYSPMNDARYRAWLDRRLYLECRVCGFARTVTMNEGIKVKDVRDCEACHGSGTVGPVRYWMRPPGFAHPIDEPVVTSPDDIPEVSYATRAKLMMQSPEDPQRWTKVHNSLFVLNDRTHLLVSNAGPRREGYNYCTKCGRIEAVAERSHKLHMAHAKPYPDEEQQMCEGDGASPHLVLGADFITDVALYSLRVDGAVSLQPGAFATGIALRTVSEALARAACIVLGIEAGEVMAEYRPALTPAGVHGEEAEIFLYDTLPGGAGFAKRIAASGVEIFRAALDLMRGCAEQCDISCYRCLRTFRNKIEHGLLDRHVGAVLVEYLLTGNTPPFNENRTRLSSRALYSDLSRQNLNGVRLLFEDSNGVPEGGAAENLITAVLPTGSIAWVALSVPLVNTVPADIGVRRTIEAKPQTPLILVSELLVRHHLPAATSMVLDELRRLY